MLKLLLLGLSVSLTLTPTPTRCPYSVASPALLCLDLSHPIGHVPCQRGYRGQRGGNGGALLHAYRAFIYHDKSMYSRDVSKAAHWSIKAEEASFDSHTIARSQGARFEADLQYL